MSFDFPANPTQGQEYTAIVNGLTYVYVNTQWVVKDQDAPANGLTYGRKDKQWQQVNDQAWPDAPADGKNYARRNNAWTDTFLPATTNAYDLGSATLRWRTIYTSDLSLKNEAGDWTIVEGEDELFIHNNRNGKVYKFVMIEVDPSRVPAKKV